MTNMELGYRAIIAEPLNVQHLDGEVVVHEMARMEGSLTPEAATVTAHRLLTGVEELRRLDRA